MTLTDEQTKLRSRGMGASDTPAVLGLDPWRNAIDVWRKKVGEVPEQEDSDHAKRGVYLEPALREWASDEIGLRFAPSPTLVHPERKLILATPDGVAMDGSRTAAVLELKSPGPHTGDEWGDDDEGAPDRYVVQLAQQMAVTGAPYGFIAALVDGRLRIYRFERDRELEQEAMARAEEFWSKYVETRTPPEVDGSQSAHEWLAYRFPASTRETIQATDEDESLLLQLDIASAALKEAESRRELICQRIKSRMGDAGTLNGAHGRITWRTRNGSVSTDWQAIARHLGATKQHEQKFTKTSKGSRAFRFTPAKESK